MIQYTTAERILTIKEYIRARSYLKTQNAFGIQFSVLRVSSKFTIHYCYQKFSVHKRCLNWNRWNSCRPGPAKTEENLILVQNILRHNSRGVSYCKII